MVKEEAKKEDKNYSKALNYLLNEDYNNARLYFQKSIKQYPDEPYSYYQLMHHLDVVY